MNDFDKMTVQRVAAYLERNPRLKATITEDPYDPIDIVASAVAIGPTGPEDLPKPIAVEVKGRPFPHDRYATMMVEKKKIDAIRPQVKAGKYGSVMLACVYSDDVLMIGNPLDPRTTFEEDIDCPATTCFADRGTTTKATLLVRPYDEFTVRLRPLEPEAGPAGLTYNAAETP